MPISNTMLIVFAVTIVLMVAFVLTLTRTRNIMLIHKCYFAAASLLIIWLLALIGIRYTNLQNTGMMIFWDAITTSCAALIPPFSLLFAICYTKEYEHHLPKRYLWVFAIPSLTILMVSTNPLHHLYYTVFSLENTKVQFGPYFSIHSFYSFACVALSVFLIIRFAVKTKTKLHIQQAVLFTIGSLAPSILNLIVVSRLIDATIEITPLGFMVTMLFHGFVIYRLHFFDIKPIAMQQLLNWISDCYLVTNQSGLVINYNQPFMNLLGNQQGIRENVFLKDCLRAEDVENKTTLYNLLTAIQSCTDNNDRVTYEQAITKQENGEPVKGFYMVEVTPLTVDNKICGFLVIFKDVTQIKLNMQQLQDNQVKMMERERLAFLGQMVGGLAHNLKTPIMSISGSISATETLLRECEQSLGDPEVTEEDYREIYGEIGGWCDKIREACAYMSDIISAVKGQASNMNVSEGVEFSLEDTIKRVALLLRHELLNKNCSLKIDNHFSDNMEILLHGDINNLVQVIANLVSNAIDAQKPDGNHDIVISLFRNDTMLHITVKDYGIGVSPQVRKSIFQQMVTSKGTLGTGLGVFISNTVIRAKFDGSMWFEDNPEGGTIFGIAIPMENVKILERKEVDGHEEE